MYKTNKIHMGIYEPFNATILIISADLRTSMHDLNLLRPLVQYSWNWKIFFKDSMHHCDQKLGVIRVHGWYFCSYTLLKHTLASCKIFRRLGDCKMHQNDLNVGILLILLQHKSFCSMKVSFFFGGGGRSGLIFGILFRRSEYGL